MGNSTVGAITTGIPEAEGFSPIDLLVVLTASVSMVILVLTLLMIVFIFYRVRDDFTLMTELNGRTTLLEQRNQEGQFISDQVTNVLYDLYRMIASIKGIIELQRLGFFVNEELFDLIERDVMVIEKHFAEIGLLSVDKERRISAQQSLANFSGDAETLGIMQDVSERKIGVYDDELAAAIRQLKVRIAGNIVDASSWTGRPSGGAF
jgi:hypothetical protein